MLEVIFLTSNNVKLAHARYLCRDYNVFISKQKHYGVSYEEPRFLDRNELLKASMRDAYRRLNEPEEVFFFIEDTSVTINALSQEGEVPGVDVKYWMQEITFEKLDKLLKDAGNDRTVKVRSDIVLWLPRRLRLLADENEPFKSFTSSVRGRIVDKESEFPTQPFYSWLDNKTFNKWFIPEDCDTIISLLPIDEAERHDFRAGSFMQMLQFLEQFNVIKKKILTKNPYQEDIKFKVSQRNLFTSPPVFIVCGFTCSGKTTLAEHITNNYNYYHIEASDYMYLSYYMTHGVGSSVTVGNFAEQALKDYPNIVVDQIINDIDGQEEMPVILTGFRSPEEIEEFKRQYRGDSPIKIIFIETEQALRYRRCVERSRFDKHKNYEEFTKNDEQQIRMGLEDIKSQQATSTISNNGTFEEYYNAFELQFKENLSIVKGSLPSTINYAKVVKGLEDEIILALYNQFETEKYFTTTQTAGLINELFYPTEKGKSKNNVSRYFNQYFHAFYEVKLIDGKRKYRLSQTGVGRAKWLLRTPLQD